MAAAMRAVRPGRREIDAGADDRDGVSAVRASPRCRSNVAACLVFPVFRLTAAADTCTRYHLLV